MKEEQSSSWKTWTHWVNLKTKRGKQRDGREIEKLFTSDFPNLFNVSCICSSND